VQHAGMLHALSRPCGQIAAPMGPPQPWGFPWLAWHPLWPRVCLSCWHRLMLAAWVSASAPSAERPGAGCTAVPAAACRLQAAALRPALLAAVELAVGPPTHIVRLARDGSTA
jgi:hypothetical protein